MLDWLTSKFAMIIAALLILTSAFCLIGAQRDSLEEFEFKLIADKIADNVNAVSSSHGETKLLVSFVNNSDAASLPSKVGGKQYTINITQDFVMVTQDSKIYSSRLSTSVHPWDPSRYRIESKDDLEENDERDRFFIIASGSGFVVERKLLFMEDGNEFHTFVY